MMCRCRSMTSKLLISFLVVLTMCAWHCYAGLDLILECMAWNKTTSKFVHGLYFKICIAADAMSEGLPC